MIDTNENREHFLRRIAVSHGELLPEQLASLQVEPLISRSKLTLLLEGNYRIVDEYFKDFASKISRFDEAFITSRINSYLEDETTRKLALGCILYAISYYVTHPIQQKSTSPQSEILVEEVLLEVRTIDELTFAAKYKYSLRNYREIARVLGIEVFDVDDDAEATARERVRETISSPTFFLVLESRLIELGVLKQGQPTWGYQEYFETQVSFLESISV